MSPHAGATILLGTVAIEPIRWVRPVGAARPETATAPIHLAAWMDRVADAGFDGIEVWEPHVLGALMAERDRIVQHALPIVVWNSYVSLDDDDPAQRAAIGEAATAAGATGIKYNVGNDPAQVDAYAARVAAWLEVLPDAVRLLCECHAGTAIAEDPALAARLFQRAGGPERVQAIVHTHESDEHLRARFDHYGERIAHVHVNFLDPNGLAPPLAQREDRLVEVVSLLRSRGFDGSWTIEFCHGLNTDRDRPDALIDQAADDLAVLRRILGDPPP